MCMMNVRGVQWRVPECMRLIELYDEGIGGM